MADTTRTLTRAQVDAIWKLGAPLRDKALWKMLYETAARAEEVLGLDVPDLGDDVGREGQASHLLGLLLVHAAGGSPLPGVGLSGNHTMQVSGLIGHRRLGNSRQLNTRSHQ